MEESSPIKHKPTSRVIDSLHSDIDGLKNELESLKVSHDNYKKNYTVATKKNDLFVDQLANAKHENDMINALLKRKERRITDLEDQYNELCSTNMTLNLNNKNMKIRCDNLQESSASSTAEYERLKIAYDALIASQVEYKRHYEKQLNDLISQFESYKRQNLGKYTELNSKLSNNDKDIDTLLDSLTNKRRTMDNLYVNKNRTVLELLSNLAQVAKLHGQESKSILNDNVENIKLLVEKYPDLEIKLNSHENSEINLENLISESNDTLSNFSFDEESSLGSLPNQNESNNNTKNMNRNNSISMKKRKNKRNSRIDVKNNSEFNNLPSRNNSSKRAVSNNNSNGNNTFESSLRNSTSPLQENKEINVNDNSVNPLQYSNQKPLVRNSNKSKRKSMYGNNNNENSNNHNNNVHRRTSSRHGSHTKNSTEVAT